MKNRSTLLEQNGLQVILMDRLIQLNCVLIIFSATTLKNTHKKSIHTEKYELICVWDPLTKPLLLCHY